MSKCLADWRGGMPAINDHKENVVKDESSGRWSAIEMCALYYCVERFPNNPSRSLNAIIIVVTLFLLFFTFNSDYKYTFAADQKYHPASVHSAASVRYAHLIHSKQTHLFQIFVLFVFVYFLLLPSFYVFFLLSFVFAVSNGTRQTVSKYVGWLKCLAWRDELNEVKEDGAI